MKKRLNEIKERKKALAEELKGEVTEERVKEIEDEVEGLEKEEQMIERKLNIQGKLEDPIQKPEQDPGNDAEQRAARIKESGRMEIPVSSVRGYFGGVKERATTITTDSLAKPTGAGSVIRDNLEGVSSIVDQVYVSDLTGCAAFEEPYVKTNPEATERTDGSAGTGSDPVFRVASIAPMLINVTSYVSKNIERLTPAAYAQKVQSLALAALRRKVGKLIANGETGKFNGIKIAQNTKKENIFKTYTVNSNVIGAETLRDIVFSYGGSEEIGPNARLFLTKEDLAAFGKVRGTNEKKAVYEITADRGNANTGTIKDGGTIVPYTILSGLTSLSSATQTTSAIQTMIYGDPMNFELGLFGPYTVEVSKDYKFAEGLLTIMGEVMAGGNIIVDEGFVVVTLAAKTG